MKTKQKKYEEAWKDYEKATAQLWKEAIALSMEDYDKAKSPLWETLRKRLEEIRDENKI